MKKHLLSCRTATIFLNAVVLSMSCIGAAYGDETESAAESWSVSGPGLAPDVSAFDYDSHPDYLGMASGTGSSAWLEPDHKYTFEQLGAQYPFQLRGIDGSDNVYFNVRADELVTRAETDLTYSYSPALLSEYSHINVLVNGEVAYSIPVPRDEAGRVLKKNIELPAHLFTEFNQIRFQLIGHYTLECEDPLHTSLWASVSNKSTLSVDIEHINLPNELSRLPVPFFDWRDGRRLSLPIVLASNRSEVVMESAGMIASWFGALAGYRGAEFPVHLDSDYPTKGNAIVLMKADGSTTLPVVDGPTLTITENPNDSNGKLLWVLGRDDQEIKQAAQALVTGSVTLSGQAVTVKQIQELEHRRPYDAPNWVPTDRPVMFGEIVPEQTLRADGYSAAPIRMNLRLPPDLFGWKEKPVPVDLRYRYTVQPGKVDSSLIVSADQQFLRSFLLLSAEQIQEESWTSKLDTSEMLPVQAKMEIPLDQLLAQPELEFLFMYDYIKEGSCRDIIIDNVRGRIDPDSTIDFSGYPHFMLLPDLKAFGESGFPYTRLADLSETVVVLSDTPAIEDISTYLTLMGRFGESTGYPATRITVKQGQSGLTSNDKDLIVISSGDQHWLSPWADYLPTMINGQSKHFGTSDLIFKKNDWKTPNPLNSQRRVRTDLTYDGNGDVAAFVGFESPVSAGRSAVLIVSSWPEGQALAAKALLGGVDDLDGRLAGNIAVVHKNGIVPLAQQYSYTAGQLGFWRGIQWKLTEYWPGLPSFGWLGWLLLVILVFAMIAAILRMTYGRRRSSGARGANE